MLQIKGQLRKIDAYVEFREVVFFWSKIPCLA
jgi:hypothetical protein